jgi:eukaryotic-like serine/threonine-protein kinase
VTTIKLPKGEWEYDLQAPLGKPGGFGQVFVGRGNGYDRVAVKRLHLKANDAAHRELEIANELAQFTLEHVIPVLDAGQDALSDYYFVVMPCAEKSLQDEFKAVGKFNEADAVRILQDIAAGLVEARKFVHRDLKPLNILFHDGRWKIADFGIARFVEESTSLQTLKECLSPPYAAPEQFKLEHATSATYPPHDSWLGGIGIGHQACPFADVVG